ncbi:MAG: hypothetical protein JRJ00_06210 [Deltaproteobacteria bacterium]|nr:hypothetical protein [Deltaproteobacteria bacterium]
MIVETKLWKNPESRREVVAQVLDMALAFSKWDFEQLENQTKSFTSKSHGREFGLEKLLEKEFGQAEFEYSEFRDSAEKNLELGRFLVAVVGDNQGVKSSFDSCCYLRS